jgi:hypothetical protein
VRVDDVRKPHHDIAPDEVLVAMSFAASAAAIFTNTPMGQFLSRRRATLSQHRSHKFGHEFSGVIEVVGGRETP